MGQFVASGDAVVVSDYEGENLGFGAERQSGYATLDGIRAAESLLHRSDPNRVGMVGYSGGSIATEFAAELAPKYAPDVKLVGAAAGGVPVDLADNLHYVDGSPVWSSTIPGIIDGVSRAFGANFKPFANAYGRKLMRAVSGQCLGQYLGKYPGLTAAKIFKPKFKNVLRIPAWATMSNRLIMGTAGTPKVPERAPERTFGPPRLRRGAEGQPAQATAGAALSDDAGTLEPAWLTGEAACHGWRRRRRCADAHAR